MKNLDTLEPKHENPKPAPRFVHFAANDKGALTQSEEKKEQLNSQPEISEFKNYQRKDGRFVSSGYDVESVAKMNEDEG